MSNLNSNRYIGALGYCANDAVNPVLKHVLITRVDTTQFNYINNKSKKMGKACAYVMREIIQYYMDNHNES